MAVELDALRALADRAKGDDGTEAALLFEGRVVGFTSDGQTYLQRCGACRAENWAPAVARGVCAWCGWRPPAPEEGGTCHG